jgi:photosystem II stability/assembly factor-like uncharacterized protein
MKRNWLVACLATTLVLGALMASPAWALQPDGSNGWYWQMPQPAGGIAGLSALAFPDASNVWAVGAGGLVLHSSDAGLTWETQPTPTNDDLWSVSFPDAQHGWACGGPLTSGGGVVLATTDDSASWQNVTPSGLKASLTDVSFADASHGLVGTSNGQVLMTGNGGGSWTSQRLNVEPIPSLYGGPPSADVVVDLVSATQGWAAVNNQLFLTMSGGHSWLPMPSELSPEMVITQVDFSDLSHGWLLAYSQYTGASTVLATSDGGFLWRKVSIGNVYVSALDATSASGIWLLESSYVTNYEAAELYGEGGGTVTVEHSSDGGVHWTSSSLAAPYSAYTIAADGADVCCAGDGILVSGNDAATWQSATSGQEYFFTAAQAVSANDIWATDDAGALLHSSDGTHWTEQASPLRWVNSLDGVSFPDANDGWVVGTDGEGNGSSVILHTSDAGATWQPQQSNLSGELDGVDFVNDTTGWAISWDNYGMSVGAPLTMEHTTDGGQTWVPQYVYDNACLYAVDFIDATTGWACGYYQPSENSNGLPGIFVTTNGGLTWAKEKVPAEAQEISDLQFLDASDGWAVGTSYDENDNLQQGWVLHTTDGGQTWNRLTALSNVLADTVSFTDASDGWIGGLNGVWATTDGGASWQQVAGGEGVTAIAATDASHVWAFGDGFLISPLDASGDTAAPVTLVNDFQAWYDKPATITLSPNDIGGGTVQSTQFSTDGGASWQSGTTVSIDAPADHGNDGEHTVLYRSSDTAGNQEQTESLMVGIDTLGPACSVPRKAVVDTGKTGTLYFMAEDATSDVARATVSIVGRHGQTLRRFVELPGLWWTYFTPWPYYYLRFHCALKLGTYHVEVRATDQAGNAQAVIGWGLLRVVRKGAPGFSNPGWPAGLPASSPGFAKLLKSNLEVRRLLQLRALRPGPWQTLLRLGLHQ